MLKTIALIGLAAALALPSAPAFAVNGDSSSYGTEGYGPTVPTQSLTPFQRSWNHANESKERARAGAAWLRHHRGYGHYHRLDKLRERNGAAKKLCGLDRLFLGA